MPFKDKVIILIENAEQLGEELTAKDIERLAEDIDRAAKDSVELIRYFSDGEGKDLRKLLD